MEEDVMASPKGWSYLVKVIEKMPIYMRILKTRVCNKLL